MEYTFYLPTVATNFTRADTPRIVGVEQTTFEEPYYTTHTLYDTRCNRHSNRETGRPAHKKTKSSRRQLSHEHTSLRRLQAFLSVVARRSVTSLRKPFPRRVCMKCQASKELHGRFGLRSCSKSTRPAGNTCKTITPYTGTTTLEWFASRTKCKLSR